MPREEEENGMDQVTWLPEVIVAGLNRLRCRWQWIHRGSMGNVGKPGVVPSHCLFCAKCFWGS